MPDVPTHSVSPAPPPDTALSANALTCPACNYLLLGLPEPRCPECGRAFSWNDPDLLSAHRDRLSFEKARGLRVFPAFVATWLTVVFVPCRFARLITTNVSTPHALTFAAVCFASTTLSFVFGDDLPTFLAWMLTALSYIIIQAGVLSLIDWPGWKTPRMTFRFWLLAGCYTSAIMVTEFCSAPPLLTLRSFADFFRDNTARAFLGLGFGGLLYGVTWADTLSWLQILLWLAGLTCCLGFRLARAGVRPAVMLPYALAIAIVLSILYGAAIQFIGEPLYDLFE